jgi:hypothetical protein
MFSRLSNKCNKWEAPVKPRRVSSTLTRFSVRQITAAESGLPELQSFAAGVAKDKAAVQAGLTWPVNNGQVEGQVTTLKLTKRTMYGRAARLWRGLTLCYMIHFLPGGS